MRSHPDEKLGRNDPCPCGSGRKYKRCCLMKQTAAVDTPWRQQREASDRLTDEMLKFARRKFEHGLLEAWADFNQDDFPGFIDDHPHEVQIFFPYFLFDWDPDRPRLRRGQRPKPGIVAQAFLLERARRLPDLERMILELSIRQPVSFYEVVRCEPDHGMRLRDILIGGETEVEEHSGSRHAQAGDILYGQLCPLPQVTTLSRMAPVAMPPRSKPDVVVLRAWLRRKIAKQNRALGVEDLFRYADKIRLTYLEIRDRLHAPPRLVNTDGDPLELHTLTYRVGSAQVAFDALAPLARGWPKEELLEDAEVDDDGTLRSVAFDWIKKGNAIHKHWDNTILGHLKISGRSLAVDVNSAKRAKEIREEIEHRLGMLAVPLGTRVETAEEMMEKAKQKEAAGPGHQKDEDPELIRLTQELLQRESEAWVHKQIPILGGRTPKEAVADPDGREIVESLLMGWERDYQGSIRPDIDAVRRLLNLPLAMTSK